MTLATDYIIYTLSLSLSQGGEFHLTWSPVDLSQQDVASLYLAQADSWAMVDQYGMYSQYLICLFTKK